MSRHDDSVRLGQMLSHAVEAVDACRTRARSDLDSDRFFNLGLVRLIEFIGEAAARVSGLTRHSLPKIPWSQVTGMRNHLVYG